MAASAEETQVKKPHVVPKMARHRSAGVAPHVSSAHRRYRGLGTDLSRTRAVAEPRTRGTSDRGFGLQLVRVLMSRTRTRVALDVRGLIDRVEIFRLANGRKRDAMVQKWLDGKPAELRTIAKRWFSEMRGCGDDVGEQMHDGCPVACIEDAPFGYVNTF